MAVWLVVKSCVTENLLVVRMRPSPATRTSDGTAPESEGSTRLPSFGDFSWGDAQYRTLEQIVQANPFAGVCSCLGATPAGEADAPAEGRRLDERPPSEPRARGRRGRGGARRARRRGGRARAARAGQAARRARVGRSCVERDDAWLADRLRAGARERASSKRKPSNPRGDYADELASRPRVIAVGARYGQPRWSAPTSCTYKYTRLTFLPLFLPRSSTRGAARRASTSLWWR